MNQELNTARKAWNAPKLQRLPAANANGQNGTQGDGGTKTRS